MWTSCVLNGSPILATMLRAAFLPGTQWNCSIRSGVDRKCQYCEFGNM
ncbi:hypothetical protein Slin14017_G063530 [Septoria linicola]|nr:hypothetical protein Slin14017_G063530 [Septoria linicola]